MSIKIITENKKARFDFVILDTYEAGLVLTGSEVKSLRDNQANLKDSYISFKGEEAFLQNAHIAEYSKGSYFNHDPQRLRKLLLHKDELKKIFASIREKGLSCIPLKLYFKRGKAKVEIALAKGKNRGDKRESIKKRDVNLELQKLKRKDR
jgi:SsrA-binding protein